MATKTVSKFVLFSGNAPYLLLQSLASFYVSLERNTVICRELNLILKAHKIIVLQFPVLRTVLGETSQLKGGIFYF